MRLQNTFDPLSLECVLTSMPEVLTSLYWSLILHFRQRWVINLKGKKLMRAESILFHQEHNSCLSSVTWLLPLTRTELNEGTWEIDVGLWLKTLTLWTKTRALLKRQDRFRVARQQCLAQKLISGKTRTRNLWSLERDDSLLLTEKSRYKRIIKE